ncbi:N-acetyltransferase [Motilimonas eburnea]|uniref:N-acetyltransferase n=1 Tax=Motilimonas eburnea TaxID=1737488 RepID=UPI001E30B398|nr:N-acetyltransferase [Motilimonas eburnea]MCE2571764.1 N-acetyltransferase [Motilimonas eburnea]
MEAGYEDIYSNDSYIDSEIDGNRALVHMLYVPPHLRGQKQGTTVFKVFLSSLPAHVEVVRLKATALGSGDTLPFWLALGFTPAYAGGNEETRNILHLPVNGHSLPAVEELALDEERHYIFD